MGAIDTVRDQKAARVQEKRDLAEYAEIKKASSSDEQRRSLQEAYDLGVADSTPRYRTPAASVDNILSSQGAIDWFADSAEPMAPDTQSISGFASGGVPTAPQGADMYSSLGEVIQASPQWDPSTVT